MAAAFPDVDRAVFAWFCEQRVKKVPLSGKVLQHKALDFTSILCHDSFKASSGWSSHFKACHDVVAKVISEEAAAIDSMATSMIRTQYLAENIWTFQGFQGCRNEKFKEC
ncbi:hypothetical protein HPB52_005607 [Rhipicephalus sanguineus]|uniref:HTH CENPB-type domain-containing protein n=1 Tax=Rhipicephalus sanguineus TaxID=34632 RepID=A0A9D4PK27_RHISA|nr:hypothetical protein HPB52_005607 [Rhipicephalus sanguineus]